MRAWNARKFDRDTIVYGFNAVVMHSVSTTLMFSSMAKNNITLIHWRSRDA